MAAIAAALAFPSAYSGLQDHGSPAWPHPAVFHQWIPAQTLTLEYHNRTQFRGTCAPLPA